MACVRGICLTFIMLMIAVGMVKGRWLEPSPYSTSSKMISDGIHHMNHDKTPAYIRTVASDSSTMLYGEKRCESIYGFLPCADTMAEGVFLMFMYTYLMMLGEDWIHRGGEALFDLLGGKAIGGSVFQVLMALPRIVVVIVAGVVSTESAAQDQVAFGANMYAGSTLITLTFIWGFSIILSIRDKLRENDPIQCANENQQDSSSTMALIKHKLSFINKILHDVDGVKIDEDTKKIALVMLESLIPFVTVELVALIKSSRITILFTLIVSGVSVVVYFAYVIWKPLIYVRSLAYLKEENLQIRFIYRINKLVEGDLIDEHGNPNSKLQRIFEEADKNKKGNISQDELKDLIEEVLKLEKHHIAKEYAKNAILTHFDADKSGKISWSEFQEGCTKWLQKWKNIANNSNSVSKNLWKKVEKSVISNNRQNFTKIEKIMPTVLKHFLEKQELVKKNGEPNREKIEELFSQYDSNGDNHIHRDELKDVIETLGFAVALDHDTVFNIMQDDFNKNGNHDTMEKNEFVEGLIKWIHKAINHDPNITDPKQAIDNFEKYAWAEFDAPNDNADPKTIVYAIFGVGVMYVISAAFMQSILQFSNAAHIPFQFTSFVVFPIAMNTRMVITSLLSSEPSVTKNASLRFSKIYSGLVMNNLLGLLTLLITVYMKGLSWTYSNEMLTIMIPCALVGLFALKRDTYPLWASVSAMVLYPIYVCLFYVLGS